MDATNDSRVGTDIDGKPITVGDRVAWGVKGHLRLGSVVEHHHTYEGKVRGGTRTTRIMLRVTTLTEDKPQGRGGVFLDTDLLVIPNKE